jgi:hypothetical protein
MLSPIRPINALIASKARPLILQPQQVPGHAAGIASRSRAIHVGFACPNNRRAAELLRLPKLLSRISG